VTRPVRFVVFAFGALGVAAILAWGLAGVPRFGHYRGPYGNVLNHRAVAQRHATNVVNAVVFDYRGIDTVGEEFILFAAVMGVTLLLRVQREEHEVEGTTEERAEEQSFLRTSDALRVCSLALIAPTVALGMYVVVHGHLTPGGGFQGGVILGAAPLFIYLAGRYLVFRSLNPLGLLDFGEGMGAAGFVAVGLVGLVSAQAFLQDVWPLGQVRSVFSGGMLPVINLSVGLEVAAGLVLVIYEFMEQTLLIRSGRTS
jgi:multicomponent Na+:H+ antiporter subunit B